MSIAAMKQALEWAHNHGEVVFAGGGMRAVAAMDAWAIALRDAIEQAEKQEPTGKEVELNIIRWWPDGFADRLERVWKDLIGFIPNYKLYDLQRTLAEYGFTMKVYDGAAPPQRQPLTDEEIDVIGRKMLGAGYGGNTDRDFARAIEAAHGIRG